MKQGLTNLFGLLAVGASLNLCLSTAFAQGNSFARLAITNPTPAAGDCFGWSVAVVGNDRVLIGAYGDNTGAVRAGAAYLLSANGALLTTFTNPTPAASDYFGWSLTAVGSDRILIGAWGDDTGATDSGAAYLFSTSGVLIKTFTNPSPAAGDLFGISVSAVGADRVMIGTPYDNTGASGAGAAYLFSTDGAVLTTFTNPTPAVGDLFGSAVSAVGADRVLIGAFSDNTGATDAGAAYLFSTNGSLLATFTNPTPAVRDYFGYSLAAVGVDQVLIGAYQDDTGTTDAGAAYLFSTNGTLLITFTNPTPAVGENFGWAVAAVGADRVLIGASYDDAGTQGAGAAYLFSTDGTLLVTFTNPAPAANDVFGYSVAAVSPNCVLIGAPFDDTDADNAGVVYLFSASVPSLSIDYSAPNTVAVSWPSPSTGWMLQENTNGVASINWSNTPGMIQDDGTNKTFILNPPTGNRFYRLFKP